uniref:Proline-rich nuclear receptor coactivator 2 n=1 Tax=Clastoptera arizonana TaxID=38151 RepID=A0A1B6CP37_9HEMI
MAKDSETKFSNNTSSKCYSRVVKSSLYYNGQVTPTRGKHRLLDNSKLENVEKKSKFKPLERIINMSSPNNIELESPSKFVTSPSKEGNQSPSPTLGTFYAGAKFSEPPSPNALPKPPSHWTPKIRMSSGGAFPFLLGGNINSCNEMHLKMLLNVKA